MVLISYDISNDKKRTKFSKYIQKFGSRLQFSVYEIDNSERILKNIIIDLQNRWMKSFDESDSVYIFVFGNKSKIYKYGYAKHEDTDLLVVN